MPIEPCNCGDKTCQDTHAAMRKILAEAQWELDVLQTRLDAIVHMVSVELTSIENNQSGDK